MSWELRVLILDFNLPFTQHVRFLGPAGLAQNVKMSKFIFANKKSLFPSSLPCRETYPCFAEISRPCRAQNVSREEI